MIITISVPGQPQPCQYQQTKKGVIYQKPNTKQWQKAIGMTALTEVRKQCAGFKLGMYFGTVECSAIFRLQPSPTMLKGFKRAGISWAGYRHLQKPDVTNLWKSAEDALKHILWADDCQVQSVMIQKMWSNGNPGVEIRVDLVEYAL